MSARHTWSGRLIRGVFLGLIAGCSSAPSPEAAVHGEVRALGLHDEWEAAAPERFGLAREPLDGLTAAIRAGAFPNVHAVLIAKDGVLVYEECFEGLAAGTRVASGGR